MLTGVEAWGERDRVIAVALTIYEGLLCPECGLPVTICRDPARDGWIEVRSSTCLARKAIAEHTGVEGYQAEPGEILYPHPTEPQGKAGGGYGAKPEGW